jgi:hypothetical protein
VSKLPCRTPLWPCLVRRKIDDIVLATERWLSWLKAAVLKTVKGVSSSRVRIPLSPHHRASTRHLRYNKNMKKFTAFPVIGIVLWSLVGLVAYYLMAQVLAFLPVPYWIYADDRPLVYEVIDVIGPTPEKHQRFSSVDSSGLMIGYFLRGGNRYYVKNGKVNGPYNWGIISKRESSSAYWRRGHEIGWPVELGTVESSEQSDIKGSSTLRIEKFGPKKDCFDSAAKSKVNVYHNETLVGTEKIKNDECQTAFRGGILSDDGSRHAYIVRDRSGYFVVSHGKRSSNYVWIQNLHFQDSVPVFNATDSSGKNYIRVSME